MLRFIRRSPNERRATRRSMDTLRRVVRVICCALIAVSSNFRPLPPPSCLVYPVYYQRVVLAAQTCIISISSRNAVLHNERQTPKPFQAASIHSPRSRFTRSLCCYRQYSRLRTSPDAYIQSSRDFDHLSQHLRRCSDLLTSYSSCRRRDTCCWQYHQGCDQWNTKYSPTRRCDSTSFPSPASTANPSHHRDTSRTRKIWTSLPSDYICFTAI